MRSGGGASREVLTFGLEGVVMMASDAEAQCGWPLGTSLQSWRFTRLREAPGPHEVGHYEFSYVTPSEVVSGALFSRGEVKKRAILDCRRSISRPSGRPIIGQQPGDIEKLVGARNPRG